MERFEITQEIIQRLNLQIGSSVRNEEVSIHCPHHQDKTPSMFINSKMGVYKCFSCGRKGSVEGLFRDLTGTSIYQVLGVQRDDFSSAAWKIQSREPVSYETIGKTILIEAEGEILPLRSHPAALQYLRRRGISTDVADSMKMRVAVDARFNHTLFKNRLIIPITERKQVISIEGRDLTGTEARKVLYPKDSSVNTLYNIDNISITEPLYLVEGLMDLAVLLKEPEFKNSSAMFGAAVTNRQLYLLDKFPEVIIIPDNDRAGSEALAKIVAHRKNSNTYILQVPKEIKGLPMKDVGDVVAKTDVTIRRLLEKKWLKTVRRVTTN